MICEICNIRVTNHKCSLCDKYVCESPDCAPRLACHVADLLISIPFCKSCFRKINGYRGIVPDFFSDDFKKEMKDTIVGYFKKKIILDKLREDDEYDA